MIAAIFQLLAGIPGVVKAVLDRIERAEQQELGMLRQENASLKAMVADRDMQIARLQKTIEDGVPWQGV